MRRLQAESAARHGVLVESLSGIETVRATGAEARMQNAWERSVAATARSGEEVHFWSSLALTSASTAQQLNYLLMVIVGVFLILDGKITVGVLVASHHAVGPRARPNRRYRDRHHARSADLHHAQGDQPDYATRARAPAGTHLCRAPHRKGSVAFDNVTFRYPELQRKRAGQGLVQDRRRRADRDHRPRRLRQDHRRPLAGRLLRAARTARSSSTTSMRASTTRPICAPASASCCRIPTSSSARSATTSRSESRTRPTRKSSPPRGLPASKTSSPATRSATTCRSRKAGAACRADRSRRSALPAPSSASRKCCSSTSRPRTSTCAARPNSLSD